MEESSPRGRARARMITRVEHVKMFLIRDRGDLGRRRERRKEDRLVVIIWPRRRRPPRYWPGVAGFFAMYFSSRRSAALSSFCRKGPNSLLSYFGLSAEKTRYIFSRDRDPSATRPCIRSISEISIMGVSISEWRDSTRLGPQTKAVHRWCFTSTGSLRIPYAVTGTSPLLHLQKFTLGSGCHTCTAASVHSIVG